MKEDKFIEKVTQGFENELDSIPTNHELLQRIKEENPNKKRVFPLWLQSPFWSYGYGLAALLFAFLYFTKPIETKELIVYRDNPPQLVKDTLLVKDTVYIEKEIIKNNNVKLVSNTKRKKRNKPSIPQATFTFKEQYFDAEQLEEQQKSVGKSSDQSGELAQFLGVSI